MVEWGRLLCFMGVMLFSVLFVLCEVDLLCCLFFVFVFLVVL